MGIRTILQSCAGSLRAMQDGRPCFVFGHQKSGTTAIAALLARRAGTRYDHDIFYRLGWLDNDALFRGRLTARGVMDRAGYRFRGGIVKDPDLTFIMPDLLDAMPTAGAVFVVRHPLANIASILGRLGLAGDGQVAELDQLDAKPRTLWGNVLDPRRQGLPDGGYAVTLARRWARAAQLYRQVQNRVLLLRYEDFQADKAGSIDRLVGALGLPVRGEIASELNRPFQPSSEKPEDYAAFFGQQSYSKILDICHADAGEFGYRL